MVGERKDGMGEGEGGGGPLCRMCLYIRYSLSVCVCVYAAGWFAGCAGAALHMRGTMVWPLGEGDCWLVAARVGKGREWFSFFWGGGGEESKDVWLLGMSIGLDGCWIQPCWWDAWRVCAAAKRCGWSEARGTHAVVVVAAGVG